MRVNGDTDTSPLHSPKEKNILVTQAEEQQQEEEAPSTPEMRDRSPPPQEATSSSSSASFSSSSSSTISSLFSGRNCITKTTIVTELTQTLVEPHGVDIDGHGHVTIPNQVMILINVVFCKYAAGLLASAELPTPGLTCPCAPDLSRSQKSNPECSHLFIHAQNYYSPTEMDFIFFLGRY